MPVHLLEGVMEVHPLIHPIQDRRQVGEVTGVVPRISSNAGIQVLCAPWHPLSCPRDELGSPRHLHVNIRDFFSHNPRHVDRVDVLQERLAVEPVCNRLEDTAVPVSRHRLHQTFAGTRCSDGQRVAPEFVETRSVNRPCEQRQKCVRPVDRCVLHVEGLQHVLHSRCHRNLGRQLPGQQCSRIRHPTVVLWIPVVEVPHRPHLEQTGHHVAEHTRWSGEQVCLLHRQC